MKDYLEEDEAKVNPITSNPEPGPPEGLGMYSTTSTDWLSDIKVTYETTK